jgi:hypothetical protein
MISELKKEQENMRKGTEKHEQEVKETKEKDEGTN